MAIFNFSTVLLLLTTSISLITAQSTTSAASASPTAAIAIYPGNVKWGYHGCYNETTYLNGTGNARALAGGEPTRSQSMTVESCFATCNAKGMNFAGIEYTNECYCANFLNALAAKLDDSQCNLACAGNQSQACGGALKLTVYTVKSTEKGAAAVQGVPESSILALGVAMGMMLWLA